MRETVGDFFGYVLDVEDALQSESASGSQRPTERARAIRCRASDATNARSSSGGKVRSTQSKRPASAMPTFCQVSPITTPTGVHASGTRRAVMAPPSVRKLLMNAKRAAVTAQHEDARLVARARGFDRHCRAAILLQTPRRPRRACECLREGPGRIQTGQTRNTRFDRGAANLVVIGDFPRPLGIVDDQVDTALSRSRRARAANHRRFC